MHDSLYSLVKQNQHLLAQKLDFNANLHSWIEISSSKLLQNIKIIKQAAGDAQLGIIIKGNAYGHGIVPIVKFIQNIEDVAWVVAFSLSEALLARNTGFNKQILVCGYANGLIEDAILNQIDLVLHDMTSLKRYLQAAIKLARPVNVHLKVDTGLNRLGFTPQEALAILLDLKSNKHVRVRGIFSHFAESDAQDNWYAMQQVSDFNDLLDQLNKLQINIPLVHMANTVAVFRLPETCKSLVRVGGGVYGLRKNIAAGLVPDVYHALQPVITWKSKIIQIRDVPAGSYISYGRTFRAEHNMRLATMPVGYADGYARELSNNSVVCIDQVLAPVVGRVCMNLTVVDVTNVPNCAVNDEVVLLGDIDGVRINDFMARLNTIACEVTTSINWTISRFLV
jgi:alanine racemase